MSPTLDASVGTVFVNTVRGLHFSRSALNLVRLYPIGPIRLALYENAVDCLTAAFTTIQLLPFIQLPPSAICPKDSAISCLQDAQLIVKLAENQTIMAISKIRAATTYIDQVILLIGDDDSDVLCLLVSARASLVSAQTALFSALNMNTSLYFPTSRETDQS